MRMGAVRAAVFAAVLAGCGGGAQADGGSAAAVADPAACLPYGSAVTITGVAERQTYAGPAARAGERERLHFYLAPDAPVCTRAAGDGRSAAMHGVELVQLALDSVAGPPPAGRVRVTGTLATQPEGHHHAPILLRVRALHPADPPSR